MPFSCVRAHLFAYTLFIIATCNCSVRIVRHACLRGAPASAAALRLRSMASGLELDREPKGHWFLNAFDRDDMEM
jgi:hypothetical protein